MFTSRPRCIPCLLALAFPALGQAIAEAQESPPPATLPAIERIPPRAYTTPYLDQRSGLLYAVYRSFVTVPYDVTLESLDRLASAFCVLGKKDLDDDDSDSYNRRLGMWRDLTQKEWLQRDKEKRLVTLKKGEGIAGALPIWNALFWDNLVREGLETKPKRTFSFSTGGPHPVVVVEDGKRKYNNSIAFDDELILDDAVLKRLRTMAPEKRAEGDLRPGTKGRYAVTAFLDEKRGTLIVVIRSLSDDTLRIHMKSVEDIRAVWRLSDRPAPTDPPASTPESAPPSAPKDSTKRVVDLHVGEGIVGSAYIWETALWGELIHEGKPRKEKVSIVAHPVIYTADAEERPVPDRGEPPPVFESLDLDAATLTRLEEFRKARSTLIDSPIGRWR